MKIRVAFATPYSERAEFLITLDPSRHTEGQIASCLQSGMLYEPFTSWVVIGLLRPGDIAIDIGAHVGYYTLLMRTLVGEYGRVYAAEPLAPSYEALANNVASNQYANVQSFALAIAERVGRAAFQLDVLNEGESHLAVAAESHDDLDISSVETTTLDAWLDGLERPPRLVKLDAEGCEMRILDGASSFFRKTLPEAIVCEINPPALQRYASDQWQLRARLAELGYTGYLINVAPSGEFDLCGGAILKPLGENEQVGVDVVHNLLFCQPGVVPVGLGI